MTYYDDCKIYCYDDEMICYDKVIEYLNEIDD